MGSTTWRNAIVLGALLLGLVAAVDSGDATAEALEVARPRTTAGTAMVERAGSSQRVGPTTQFQEGDVLRVPAGTDRIVVDFEDGSSMTLVGPAVLEFVQLQPTGRRVRLVSGMITEAFVRGVALEIQTPYDDASFVLQNAEGFARVAPEDRVLFQRRDGAFARVYHQGRPTDLADAPWTLNLRGPTPAGAIQRAGSPAGRVLGTTAGVQQLAGGWGRIVIGVRQITFKPIDGFRRESLANGETRFCYSGPDYGVMHAGLDTILFFASGDCVEYDAYGNVIRFDGISHIYHPMTDEVFYDEPVENAADASISRTSLR